MSKTTPKTAMIRRSVALPGELVKLAQDFIAPDKRDNLNGLVKLALQEFVRQHRYQAFRHSVQQLAQDPKFIAENKKMLEDYAGADEDGLK